jgi:hypothetical protein
MTKRDEAFEAMRKHPPAIRHVKGGVDGNPMLYLQERYDGPWWTAHVIGSEANEVAAEIKRRWDSFEAMRKALEATHGFIAKLAQRKPVHSSEMERLHDTVAAALRLAEEGERG